VEAFRNIRQYEHELLVRLLSGLSKLPDVKVWGITETDQLEQRLPTVSITHPAFRSRELATRLADEGIFVWHGNYYALPLTQAIDVEPDGMVRIGLCHYNTVEEVDRLLVTLEAICASASSTTR
jgi:selenocysteine lyase/cysteine desulfurase